MGVLFGISCCCFHGANFVINANNNVHPRYGSENKISQNSKEVYTINGKGQVLSKKEKVIGSSGKSSSRQSNPGHRAKKSAAKSGTRTKNKLGVKNSLVNNINAKKKRGTSGSKKKSTVSKKAYKQMQNNWGNKK